MASTHPTLSASFADRARTASHPLAAYLYRLMELKASNLCFSADVSTARELLTLADRLGPYIVVFKTHHDVIPGWDHTPETGTGARLAALARRHGFLIFEDRKFGDIGNTVQMQYVGGTARIIDWAHIVNVNMIPGPAVVASLDEAASRWKERYHYEVKTSVSVGTPIAEGFEHDGESDNVDMENPSNKDNISNDDDHVPPASKPAQTSDAAKQRLQNRPQQQQQQQQQEQQQQQTGSEPAVDSSTTIMDMGTDSDNSASSNQLSVHGNEIDYSDLHSVQYGAKAGRKSSIVSITTVTQSWEPASSPRSSKVLLEGDEQLLPGIEEAPMDRALLILAQMSTKGNFMTADYTNACVEVARRHKGFVIGFVSQQSLNSQPDDAFIHMTPGCQLPPDDDDDDNNNNNDGQNDSGIVAEDGKGQQYNTPRKLVKGAGVDIVIVGRGILNAADPIKEARRYRREAWRAYRARIQEEQ